MKYFKNEASGEVFGFDESDAEQAALMESKIEELGLVDITGGWPPVPSGTEAKESKWVAIKAERDRRKAGGVKVGAKWFHSDDGSRIQQMGLVMMGANIPANLQWKTMDGSFITMTQALASQVVQTVAASDQAIFAVAEQHKTAMEASADPASYDYSGDWPKIYGE